jgi:hypothetical protein
MKAWPIVFVAPANILFCAELQAFEPLSVTAVCYSVTVIIIIIIQEKEEGDRAFDWAT